jgi:hypothetical protein
MELSCPPIVPIAVLQAPARTTFLLLMDFFLLKFVYSKTAPGICPGAVF